MLAFYTQGPVDALDHVGHLLHIRVPSFGPLRRQCFRAVPPPEARPRDACRSTSSGVTLLGELPMELAEYTRIDSTERKGGRRTKGNLPVSSASPAKAGSASSASRWRKAPFSPICSGNRARFDPTVSIPLAYWRPTVSDPTLGTEDDPYELHSVRDRRGHHTLSYRHACWESYGLRRRQIAARYLTVCPISRTCGILNPA